MLGACSLVFAFAAAAAASGDPPRAGRKHRPRDGVERIVGGAPVEPGAYPWMAAIHPNTPAFTVGSDTWRSYCGGSLISESWY